MAMKAFDACTGTVMRATDAQRQVFNWVVRVILTGKWPSGRGGVGGHYSCTTISLPVWLRDIFFLFGAVDTTVYRYMYSGAGY